MKQTNEGFQFDCSGREIKIYSDGISVTEDGVVRCGYDGHVEFFDDVEEEYHSNFSDEEKKELALYMIEKWSKWGGLSNGS